MISRQDWIFIGFANLVSAAIALISAKLQLGWRSAAAAVIIESLLLGVYCVRHPEPFFLRSFAFGLAAGFLELINDTWLVQKQILVYYPGGPFVIDTPLYMPFTWALMFVTLCPVAWWLTQKYGTVRAALALAFISGVYIPGFEIIAAKADWWYYQNVAMVFGLAPKFVILGEALLALPLPWLVTYFAKRSLWAALGSGAVEGILIFVTTLIALRVVG